MLDGIDFSDRITSACAVYPGQVLGYWGFHDGEQRDVLGRETTDVCFIFCLSGTLSLYLFYATSLFSIRLAFSVRNALFSKRRTINTPAREKYERAALGMPSRPLYV